MATIWRLAGRLVDEAVAQGAQLVALPEYFPIIGAADADRVRAREDFGHGPIQDWLAATAQKHGIWVFAGSIPLTASLPDKMRNSSLAYNPAGECVARYDKMHLFGFSKGEESYDEAAFIEAGSQPVAVDTPFGRIALSICYDLRFPELYRALGAGRPDPRCRPPSPTPPAARTGKSCCAPGPSRTNATCSQSDRGDAMKTAG